MKTNTEGKYILLSIQPYFANKIFDGTKTVELRRSVPKFHKDQIVILYVSTPVKAIVGGFQFSHIVEESVNELWKRVKDIAGVTLEQFSDYYSGANNGYGIFISRVWKYSTPVSLQSLRSSLSNFSPPQNFRYLHSSQAINLNLLDFDTSITHSYGFSNYPTPTVSAML
jgi:predicted transcriptional regulator